MHSTIEKIISSLHPKWLQAYEKWLEYTNEVTYSTHPTHNIFTCPCCGNYLKHYVDIKNSRMVTSLPVYNNYHDFDALCTHCSDMDGNKFLVKLFKNSLFYFDGAYIVWNYTKFNQLVCSAYLDCVKESTYRFILSNKVLEAALNGELSALVTVELYGRYQKNVS